MPNGGSDCCSTCWFNKRNKGEAFCENPDDLLPDFCNIRALPIEDPVYTYCTNHPRRRPEHDSILIGPVFTGDLTGAREVWRSSPDTDEIRNHLLSLLAEIAEQPESVYPIGMDVDEVVVWQLGEFREMKATPQTSTARLIRPSRVRDRTVGSSSPHTGISCGRSSGKDRRREYIVQHMLAVKAIVHLLSESTEYSIL